MSTLGPSDPTRRGAEPDPPPSKSIPYALRHLTRSEDRDGERPNVPPKMSDFWLRAIVKLHIYCIFSSWDALLDPWIRPSNLTSAFTKN